jgi:copper transport protein
LVETKEKTMKSFLFRLTCITFLACLQAAPSRAVQIKAGVCPVTAAAFALSANAPSAAVTVQPDESFFTHLHTEKAMANVTVSPGRAGPVVIAIQLETTDELPLQAKSVSVTLTNATASAEQAERTDDDQWQARMSAPSPGRWMLGLGISISDTDKVNIESPILIR